MQLQIPQLTGDLPGDSTSCQRKVTKITSRNIRPKSSSPAPSKGSDSDDEVPSDPSPSVCSDIPPFKPKSKHQVHLSLKLKHAFLPI
jgi:hypothetical protein